MTMWEPFTERARRSISFAQEEAHRLGDNFIGSEHMLLGLLRDDETRAAKALGELGVTLERARAEVERFVEVGVNVVQQEMVFTPRAKRIIELAFEEARQLNHNYIGTEHLLLGLIREDEGIAARTLASCGVSTAKARAKVLSLIEADPAAQRVEPQAVTHVYSTHRPAGSQVGLLTTAARHALIAATEAAQRCGSPVCSVPHLLYGIAHVEGSRASGLLADRGASAAAVERRLRAGESASTIDEDEIAMSPTAQTSLSNAIAQARGMGRGKANLEHLLLAIAAGDENDGTQLLRTLGVDLVELARALENYLKGNG